MTLARSLLGVLCASVCTAVAAAEDAAFTSAPAPDPAPGDMLVYRSKDQFSGQTLDEFSMTFQRRGGRKLFYTVENALNHQVHTQRLTADFGICGRTQEANSEVCGGAYRFPLVVGSRSSVDRQPANGGFSSYDCKVVGTERVVLAGGQFDTFRSECSGTWRSASTDGGWSAAVNFSDIHWYAPKVNAEVKYITVVRDSTASHSGAVTKNELRELIAFKPGAASAGATPPVPDAGSGGAH